MEAEGKGSLIRSEQEGQGRCQKSLRASSSHSTQGWFREQSQQPSSL